MKNDQEAAISSLTNQPRQYLVIPMNGAANAQDMLNMADKLEQTARMLRQSAAFLQQAAGVIPTSPVAGNTHRPARPFVVTRRPSVFEAVTEALQLSGGPLSIRELHQEVLEAGAFVKDQGILSSMLSKDRREHFSPVPGRRGYWDFTERLGNQSHQSGA